MELGSSGQSKAELTSGTYRFEPSRVPASSVGGNVVRLLGVSEPAVCQIHRSGKLSALFGRPRAKYLSALGVSSPDALDNLMVVSVDSVDRREWWTVVVLGLTVFFRNLTPSFLWLASISYTFHFIIHAVFTQSFLSFLKTCPHRLNLCHCTGVIILSVQLVFNSKFQHHLRSRTSEHLGSAVGISCFWCFFGVHFLGRVAVLRT